MFWNLVQDGCSWDGLVQVSSISTWGATGDADVLIMLIEDWRGRNYGRTEDEGTENTNEYKN